MAWINLQIDQTSPNKVATSVDEASVSGSVQTPSQTTSTPSSSPNEIGEKGHLKKSKGTFEFPEGGWECSKC